MAGADTAGIHRPPTHKAPQHAYRTFQADWANECWQLDDIDWELEDGSPVKIITVIDDCTRLCPGLKAAPSANGAAFEAMTAAATRWEWPQRFLSDNAKAYKHTLAAAVGALGVDHRHGRSYHPQTHGKVERFHQTLQRWLRAQPVAATLDQLQTQLDTFVDIYNNQRPHRAVGRRTPAAVYADTPKTGPADKPFGTPTPTQSQDVPRHHIADSVSWNPGLPTAVCEVRNPGCRTDSFRPKSC